MAQDTGPSQWIRGATWTLGIGLSIVTLLFSVLYNSERSYNTERHNDLEVRVTDISKRKQILTANLAKLQREVSTLEEHVVGNDKWKNRLIDIERIVYKLQSDSSARPDPWTGTEGRADARRIDRLEIVIELLQAQLAEVKKAMKNRNGTR